MECNQETGLSFSDILKLAEAYQIRYVRLDNQENLKYKLKQIIDSEGPVVCEIIMDPDQKQISKVLNRKKPEPLEDMYPYLTSEELAKNILSD